MLNHRLVLLISGEKRMPHVIIQGLQLLRYEFLHRVRACKS